MKTYVVYCNNEKMNEYSTIEEAAEAINQYKVDNSDSEYFISIDSPESANTPPQ